MSPNANTAWDTMPCHGGLCNCHAQVTQASLLSAPWEFHTNDISLAVVQLKQMHNLALLYDDRCFYPRVNGELYVIIVVTFAEPKSLDL